MYRKLYDSITEFNLQALTGFGFFTNILRGNTEQRAIDTLDQNIGETSLDGAKVAPFGGRDTKATHNESQKVLYYDFPHHQPISPESWHTEGSQEFMKHIQEITENLLEEYQQIQRTSKRYYSRYYGNIDTYLHHLRNPLFQYPHYRECCQKHIGVQRKEGNVIYAFSFSPEETDIYKRLNSMNSQWEKEKGLLVRGFSRVIQSIENLGPVCERMRLFGPTDMSDISILETQMQEIKDKLIQLIDYITVFQIEDYLTMDEYTLDAIHTGVKSNLPKRRNKSVKKSTLRAPKIAHKN